MMEMIYSFGIPITLLLVLVFLTFRMRWLSGESISGKRPFVVGSVLVLLPAVWQMIRSVDGYDGWFVAEVYPILELAQVIFFSGGGLLIVIGLALCSDFWQDWANELNSRDQRLSLLENLQRDAREPYQLLQLLEISLKEMMTQVPEAAGAVFLANRARRQLVLTSAFGFSKHETAQLEHYPFERNQISQAIDVGEPLIFGRFELPDDSGHVRPSRFQSCLVLPLISGAERLGVVVFASREANRFGQAEVRFLGPVAGWLAEKIRTARLTREASLSKDEARLQTDARADLTGRLSSITEALGVVDKAAGFCRSLVGMHESTSVHLVGSGQGPLEVYAGSEPLGDLSENFRTALIDALGRGRPLIVNQEETTASGNTRIAMSTLVYPLDSGQNQEALLFRRESAAFAVQESDLKTIGIFARLAGLVLRQEEIAGRDISRRKGFARILKMLRFDSQVPLETKPALLTEHLESILPRHSSAILFTRQSDSTLKASDGCGFSSALLGDFNVMPGEGFFGQAMHDREPQSFFGRTKVDRAVRGLETNNREALHRVFGESGPPSFAIVIPLLSLDQVNGVVAIFIDDISEVDRGEWERLLMLAAGLYSFRQTIAHLHKSLAPVQVSDHDDALGSVVNEINNQVSAIIGNAQLAAARPGLDGDTVRHIEAIIDEAQHIADYARGAFSGAGTNVPSKIKQDQSNLNDCLRRLLDQSRISGNLFMLGGKPREVESRFRMVSDSPVSSAAINRLAESAINQFARLVADEEILTLSTYRLGGHVYLDVSRHSSELPAMERLEGLADYTHRTEAQDLSSADRFLHVLEEADYAYAVDRRSSSPTYLSFKFPASPDQSPEPAAKAGGPRILAIDDQTVILDLITAMGQSLGYEVVAKSSPKEGLVAAQSESFDVVLLDLAMPGMSGLDLAAKIRKESPRIPIILLTGWEVAVNQQQIDQVGIFAVLNKPFRIEQLTDVLRSAIPFNSLS
jgi:CheY-like chemotaxis protein